MKHENQAFFEQVLEKLQSLGVLKHMVLIGSWSVYFYQSLFDSNEFSALRTQDMDFLISTPPKFTNDIDLPSELEKMGFILDMHAKGFMRLGHPQLTIDFLVPQKGGYTDIPYKIESLHLNAQPLAFMEMLLKETIFIQRKDFQVQVPHPIRLCFHKLLISPRRKKEGKREKDIQQAHEILKLSLDKYSEKIFINIWEDFKPKWKKVILSQLKIEPLKKKLSLETLK